MSMNLEVTHSSSEVLLNKPNHLCHFFFKSTGIKLPSSVFASEFEEDVGLLNKAAPVSGVFSFVTLSSG